MNHTKEPCPYCNGTGHTNEHDPCDPHNYYNCEFCDGTGIYIPWYTTITNPQIIVTNTDRNWRIGCGSAVFAGRIVACVNACAGITNEALEKGIVLDSVKLHEAILDQQPSSFFKEYGVKVWEDV